MQLLPLLRRLCRRRSPVDYPRHKSDVRLDEGAHLVVQSARRALRCDDLRRLPGGRCHAGVAGHLRLPPPVLPEELQEVHSTR